MKRNFIILAAFSLSLCGLYAQTPGGVTTSDITFMAWLKPASYNRTTSTWTNLITTSGTVGNFTQPSSWGTKTAPNTEIGAGFQPAVLFRPENYATAVNRLQSENSISITANDAFTFIVVYKGRNAYNDNYQNIFNFAGGSEYTGTNHALGYRSNGSDVVSMGWTTTARDLGSVPFEKTALLTVDNNNSSTSGTIERIRWYLNGNVNSVSYSNSNANGTATNKIVMGGAYYDLTGNGERGANVDIQEVIILKRNRTSFPFLENVTSDAAFQKIHSYLAVKYGLTLPGNYIMSDGTKIFDQTFAGIYNKNIFGIGRDNAATLNQVQNVSVETSMLTIYKGVNSLPAQNNEASNDLSDRTFLLLGANGATGKTDYMKAVNTNFVNDRISDKTSYRSLKVYQAQVTTNGTWGTGSQTVNVAVASTTARYVLVSADPTFPENNTRIYAVSALNAKNVLINHGDYVTTAGFQTLPGSLTTVTFGAWLKADEYQNGVWTNDIGGAIGDFNQPSNWSNKVSPTKQTVSTNYHPAVLFRTNSYSTAVHRLQSANGINISTNNAFSIIAVYKAANAGFDYQNILNFAGGSEYTLSNYSLGYYNNNSPQLSMGWTTTRRTLGNVPFGTMALVTVDNTNGQTTTNGIRQYVNGTQIAQANSTSGAVNNKIILGGAYYDLTGDGERGVNMDLQELIILQRPKATQQWLSDTELKRIHTYLAVKYGLTLSTDYMATDGTVVWNNAANAGYNNNIFGIGRDDNTGLYQKQAVAINNSRLKVFWGNAIKNTNNENTSVIPDNQYLIIGHNGLFSASTTTIISGEVYENNPVTATNGLNFISDAVYKAQLTGAASMTVKIQTGNTYSYAFVSKTDAFTSGATGGTKIYPVNAEGIAEIELTNEYRYIRFGGYSAGPGGVGAALGLKLWLRADDNNMLTIENLSSADPKVAEYGAVTGDKREIIPAVSHWDDYMHDLDYSYYTNTHSIQRMPVYIPTSVEMNFHPALRMWNSGTSYGSWLRCNTGVMSAAHPNHTVIFLTNNDFTTNDWVYPMSFRSQITGGGDYYGPQYGMQKVNNGIAGRVRLSSGLTNNSPNSNLFQVGSTSMTLFRINSNSITYRFNGLESISTGVSWNNSLNSDMTAYSIITGGYQTDRIINGVIAEVIAYESEITGNELRSIESYLALKYGITLRPSTAPNRFNYVINNGRTSIWDGTQTSGKFVDFYNNVAAIVRDDKTLLNNRESHSTNSGSILHVGVAGIPNAQLGTTNSIVNELKDGEAVAFGANTETSFTASQLGDCGNYDYIFNRKWLIHKVLNGNITLLIAAENNILNNLGKDANTAVKAYYNVLLESNKFFMIVAETPDDITNNNHKAIVPMSYLNGEWQCNYTFTDEDTYITFAYKANALGCATTIQFPGEKTFNWSQWTNTSNRSTTPAEIVKGSVDLGDSIQVVRSSVKFEGNGNDKPRTYALYPRRVSTPRNGLQVLRRNGTTNENSKVTTSVKFNTPVIPAFYITGLDSRRRQYDCVTIKGFCGSKAINPSLIQHSNNPSNASYSIAGNTATVNKNGSLSADNNNSRLNVEFNSGIDSLVIEYKIKNRVYRSTAQSIYISPINIRAVPPPPPVNEDGFSFVEQVKNAYITTCEQQEYAFYFENTNCDPKYVNFTTTLPANMTWETDALGLDTINGLQNTHIKINNYGGTATLTIDSFMLAGTSMVKITAIANMTANAPSDIYANRSQITYERIVNGQKENHTLWSVDEYTLEDETKFEAEYAERPLEATCTTTTSSSYKANSEVQIIYTITNPSSNALTDMYLNITWNAGFTYKAGSLTSTLSDLYSIDLSEGAGMEDMMFLAGQADGNYGFTLPPNSVTTITYTLVAPTQANLEYVLDTSDNPTATKAPLESAFEVNTEMTTPCVITSLKQMNGGFRIPFDSTTHILINKNVTTKIKR